MQNFNWDRLTAEYLNENEWVTKIEVMTKKEEEKTQQRNDINTHLGRIYAYAPAQIVAFNTMGKNILIYGGPEKKIKRFQFSKLKIHDNKRRRVRSEFTQ